jgi:hypothetical protein
MLIALPIIAAILGMAAGFGLAARAYRDDYTRGLYEGARHGFVSGMESGLALDEVRRGMRSAVIEIAGRN